MTLTIGKPTRMWAVIDGDRVSRRHAVTPHLYDTLSDAFYWPGGDVSGVIERVLVTVTRVPKKARRK